MVEWFGFVPDFLITLSASFCRDHSDVEFCALIEHELYHIAHAKNEFGMPKYSRDTGKPILAIQAMMLRNLSAWFAVTVPVRMIYSALLTRQ